MRRLLEKISILGLSLMLVSTFAVTPALPAMIAEFAGQGISGSQVEGLITVTSLAIMASLLLNPLLSRYLPETQMISLGLVLLAAGGSLPLLTQVFWQIFLGRLVLGFGLGLINARAITIINRHYQGQERLQVLGLRSSAEVLGAAGLTALVGLLLPYGWSSSFAIYLMALLILGLYLAFVPKEQTQVELAETKERLGAAAFRQALGLSALVGFVIQVNTLLTIKLPLLVTQGQLGTAGQASLVLSAMMMMGILSGICFSPLINWLGRRLLPVALLFFSTCILLISWSKGLLLLALGAILSGFFYSTVLTIVFSRASAKTPAHLLNQKMTLVLVGCNLGGATASVFPDLLGRLLPSTGAVLLCYASFGFLLGLMLLRFDSKNL